jgi:hypothetical protein
MPLVVYEMAIFSVVFVLDVAILQREAYRRSLLRQNPVSALTFTKRLDKTKSHAKIPPISGKPHCSLARLFVIAGIYDSQPAAAISR